MAQRDLMEAVEVVIAGKEERPRDESQGARNGGLPRSRTCSGQRPAKKGQPVQKITIVPRTMGTLGYTMNVPEEERYLMTKSEILAQITTLLGGRAAEDPGLRRSEHRRIQRH